MYSKYDSTIKREVTQKLDMLSRFYNTDGIFPTIGRLAVAASIILFAVFFSASIGNSSLVIYNGLPFDVVVKVDNQTVNVEKNQSYQLSIDNKDKLNIDDVINRRIDVILQEVRIHMLI